MIESRLAKIVFLGGLFAALLVFVFLVFIVFFFATVQFLDPVFRFVLSFLLNIFLTYNIVRFFYIPSKTKFFLVMAPSVICLLSFFALGIMQQSGRGFDIFFPL